MLERWLPIEIDTPAIIVDYDRLQKNILNMAQFAKTNKLQLRPHIKTHKMKEIAMMQMKHGAVGITTAKIGEAEVMVEYGIEDVTIAYPIVGESKLKRLHDLAQNTRVSTVVDDIEQAKALSSFAVQHNSYFRVLIEVDTGLKRCGLPPGEKVIALARQVSTLPRVHVIGILTHAGHAYGAKNPEEVKEIGEQEGSLMVLTAQLLKENGIPVNIVTVGSTPTVHISGQVRGVTEIRPGNYVFNDMTQVRLGVANIEDCSLRVVSTIISHPTPDRFIIDAGAKTLALDQGAHGTKGVKGYGFVVGHPELTIARLSEEHGMIDILQPTNLKIGDQIEIIPNHSCPVVNLVEEVGIVQNGQIIDYWKVAARGRIK